MRMAHIRSRVPLTISRRGISLDPCPAAHGTLLPAGRGATPTRDTPTRDTPTRDTPTHDVNPVATSKLSKA